MKNFLFTTTVFLAIFSLLNGQSELVLNINHKLGDVSFALNQETQNNMDNPFIFTRLEYYISEISIFHDGGVETPIEDIWILANASSPTQQELGSYDINTVEKIKFHVGVNPENNHLDPSGYPTGHPLAPKFPSMHWGWTAGYRFIALEGRGGSSLNQVVQLHGLGDDNYHSVEIDVDVTAENNIIDIQLDADYTRALENISVSSGLIVHGDNLQAKQCIENFRDYVFSPSSIVSSSVDISEIREFDVYPNPITNGMTNVRLELDGQEHYYDISVTSSQGASLDYIKNVSNGRTIHTSSLQPGVYLFNLIKEGQAVIAKKVLIR